MSALPTAFDATPLELALDRLLPSRPLPKDLSSTRKYEQIKVSMQEIGLWPSASAHDRPTLSATGPRRFVRRPTA